MKKLNHIALLTAALLPTYANAADFSYNYAQASYIFSSDLDVTDGDGFSFGGSFELNKDVALIASYESISYDGFFIFPGFDIDVLALGATYHMPIESKVDAVFSGGLLDGDSGSNDDTGNFLSAGIRLQANPQIEFGAALKRFDLFDDSDIGIDLSALYSIDKKNQIGVSFSDIQDVENLTFSFRVNF